MVVIFPDLVKIHICLRVELIQVCVSKRIHRNQINQKHKIKIDLGRMEKGKRRNRDKLLNETIGKGIIRRLNLHLFPPISSSPLIGNIKLCWCVRGVAGSVHQMECEGGKRWSRHPNLPPFHWLERHKPPRHLSEIVDLNIVGILEAKDLMCRRDTRV